MSYEGRKYRKKRSATVRRLTIVLNGRGFRIFTSPKSEAMKGFLSLALVLTLLATSAHTQTISRKVVLAKAQKLEQSATTRLTMEMKVFGKVEKVVNSATNRVEITVNEILDTAYQLNKRVVHATEKSESSKENYEYDSDKAADPDNPERWEKIIDRVG